MDVITGMISEFGGRLITALVELKERTEMLSSDDSSIDSGKMSVGSHFPFKELVDPQLQ